jgi:hypothetical protein
MTYYAIDTYSDEELGRIVRSAVMGREHPAKEQVQTRAALAAFFRLVGLGQFADVVLLAEYVWERFKRLVQQFFS